MNIQVPVSEVERLLQHAQLFGNVEILTRWSRLRRLVPKGEPMQWQQVLQSVGSEAAAVAMASRPHETRCWRSMAITGLRMVAFLLDEHHPAAQHLSRSSASVSGVDANADVDVDWPSLHARCLGLLDAAAERVTRSMHHPGRWALARAQELAGLAACLATMPDVELLGQARIEMAREDRSGVYNLASVVAHARACFTVAGQSVDAVRTPAVASAQERALRAEVAAQLLAVTEAWRVELGRLAADCAQAAPAGAR